MGHITLQILAPRPQVPAMEHWVLLSFLLITLLEGPHDRIPKVTSGPSIGGLMNVMWISIEGDSIKVAITLIQKLSRSAVEHLLKREADLVILVPPTPLEFSIFLCVFKTATLEK